MTDLKIANSMALYKRACKLIPAGVDSSIRAVGWTPCPIAMRDGHGSHFVDVDGNRFIDYHLAYGPLILGHSHPKIRKAVMEQSKDGTMYGTPHELAVRLAEKVVKHVPCAELVRFGTTGTEAVMNAIRIARAYAGKNKVVRFEGHFNGGYDDMLWSVHPPLGSAGLEHNPISIPETAGLPPSRAGEVIVLPWNDIQIFEKCVRRNADTIAAVITEPYLLNSGCIPPAEGYLKAMREITSKNDIVLIFDEVITGFRLGLGGGQEYFKVTPDIATFAKALGGGFPISAVAGKRELMENVATGKVFFGGTYNSNPLSVAAAIATLEVLETRDGEAYRHIYRLSKRLMKGITDLLKDHEVDGVVQGPGPVWNIFFTDLDKVETYRQASTADSTRYLRFQQELLKRGVYTHPAYLEHSFISAVHTMEDVEQTLQAVDEALGVVKKNWRSP